MLALAQYEAGVCSCGFHSSLTADPNNHFTFSERKCPVCAGTAQYARMQHAADEERRKAWGENPPPRTPDPADGRYTYVRRMAPDEVPAKPLER